MRYETAGSLSMLRQRNAQTKNREEMHTYAHTCIAFNKLCIPLVQELDLLLANIFRRKINVVDEVTFAYTLSVRHLFGFSVVLGYRTSSIIIDSSAFHKYF